MNSVLLVFVVLLCFATVFVLKPKDHSQITLFLEFSGAFLLALIFFELIPKVYVEGNIRINALCILIGILLQVFLEFFSKGAEHGHMHWKLSKNRFPIVLFLSLSLHALIEGVPLSSDGKMIYGILIHKIPVAFVLSVFLLNSRLQLSLSVLFMTLFALMTPLGSHLVDLYPFTQFKTQLMALAIGILLHISTVILFESAKDHVFDLKKLVVIVLGFGAAFVM